MLTRPQPYTAMTKEAEARVFSLEAEANFKRLKFENPKDL